MQLKTFILDKDAQSTQKLCDLIQQFCPDVNLIGTATSLTEAAIAIEATKPHLLFLDIELSDQNSLALSDYFPTPFPFELVFTTASRDYAVRAFRMGATDYLLKPLKVKELKEAVQRVKNRLKNNSIDDKKIKSQSTKSHRVALPIQNGFSFIESAEIIRCEADRSYTILFLKSGEKLIVSKPLRMIEELLNRKHFFRISRSHLINMNYLKSYGRSKNGYVTLKNGEVLSLSSAKKNVFLQLAGGAF